MTFGNSELLPNKQGKSPQERIAYQGKLEPFLRKTLSMYRNGEYLGHDIKKNGYEDFNLILHTSEQDIFLKCFAQWRNKKDCLRYLDMIQAAVDIGGVRTPQLYQNLNTERLTSIDMNGTTVNLCLMKYLDEGNIWESGLGLTKGEKEEVIKEAAKINICSYKPIFVHDSWAIINAQETYEKNRDRVGKEDKDLIDQLMSTLKSIEINKLPHAFVHGDIRSTNVMRHSDGHTYVIDFSVANWYPRVVELAVLLSDVLFDPLRPDKFNETYNWAVNLYQNTGISLTSQELKVLPTFVRLAHAMNVIGSSSVDATQYISLAENNHWLELGHAGLQFTMKDWQPDAVRI